MPALHCARRSASIRSVALLDFGTAKFRSGMLRKRLNCKTGVGAHRHCRCIEKVDNAWVVVVRIRAVRESQIRRRRPQVGQVAQLLERVVERRVADLISAQRLSVLERPVGC